MRIAQNSENRRDTVYDRLRQDIAKGRLEPGKKLSEQGLAEALGVSRTPVREALSQLMNDGLLIGLGRGYTIPDLSPQDVEHIYEMRLLIEPEIARQAATHARHQDVQALERALEREAANATASNPGPFIDANLDYRAALLAPCPNTRLASWASLLNDQICRVMHLTLGPADNREVTVSFHHAIYEGVRDGDGDRAASGVTELLYRARDGFRTMMDNGASFQQ